MTFHFPEFCVIAEIGVNHEGDFKKAAEMVALAAASGADFVKFQSYTPERYAAANDTARLERVGRFALSDAQFRELAEKAQALGVGFLSTPLSEDWVEKLDQYCPALKIASGDITFAPVIKNAAHTGKPVILSTGAADLAEIDRAVAWFREEAGEEKTRDNLILMHCVAAYPVPAEQANILSIPFLKDRYGLRTGYSNHVIGMDACLAAVAVGADIIEVHFTYRKDNQEFRDHQLSFDAADLKEFTTRARTIRSALGRYDKQVQPCEAEIRPAIRKGVIAAQDIRAGEALSAEKLMYARPAVEFSSCEYDALIGKTVNRDIPKGHLIPKEAV